MRKRQSQGVHHITIVGADRQASIDFWEGVLGMPFVFPAAVRDVVSAFAPEVRGQVLVRPHAPGVKQEPPPPVSVELARGTTADVALAEAIRDKLRDVLVVQTHVELVPWGSLRRSEYKSKLRA